MGHLSQSLDAYNFGDLNNADSQALFESYKQQLEAWFHILGGSQLKLEHDFLVKMSEGMDIMENGFYALIHRAFRGADLTKHRRTFNRAKSYFNAAISEYEANGRSPRFFEFLGECRMYIDDLKLELNADSS